MYWVCMCASSCAVHRCTCMWGQGCIPDTFFNCSLAYVLRQALSLNLEITDSTELSSSKDVHTLCAALTSMSLSQASRQVPGDELRLSCLFCKALSQLSHLLNLCIFNLQFLVLILSCKSPTMPTNCGPMMIIQLFTSIALNSLERCLQPTSDFYLIHILSLKFVCNFYIREKNPCLIFICWGLLHDYLL